MAMDSAELAPDAFDTAPDVGRSLPTEHTFRSLLEAAPDALVGVDERGVIVLANTRAERMFGYGCAQLASSCRQRSATSPRASTSSSSCGTRTPS